MPDSDANTEERTAEERTEQANIPDWVVPTITKLLRLGGRVLRLTATTAFAGLVRLGSFLSNEERQHRARRWLLLTGSRLRVTGGLVGFVFCSVFVLGLTNSVNLAEESFVTTVFGGIASGLFSFVPIVIAVNQLTISQLVATPDELRSRIESVHDFRVGIEERIHGGTVTPTEPAAFLGAVVDLISNRTTALRDATDTHDAELDETITEYLDGVERLTAEITGPLAEDDPELFDVLLLLMGDEYSANVNTARRIQNEYGDALSERTNELMDTLRELFVSMDIIRQYFKSLYIQQELADLSRQIAYAGIVSFVTSILMVTLFATGQPATESLFFNLLVSTGLAIAFSPFAVLFASVVRLATIAKRTAAPGAFTLEHETAPFR